MDLDALESFEGPRTLMIFMYLLLLTVVLVVLGTVLSAFHDITFVETIGLNLAENPMSLLNLAGGIAFLILLGKGAQLALKFTE